MKASFSGPWGRASIGILAMLMLVLAHDQVELRAALDDELEAYHLKQTQEYILQHRKSSYWVPPFGHALTWTRTRISSEDSGLMSFGFNEKAGVWNRIRVDEEGRIILAPESIEAIAKAIRWHEHISQDKNGDGVLSGEEMLYQIPPEESK